MAKCTTKTNKQTQRKNDSRLLDDQSLRATHRTVISVTDTGEQVMQMTVQGCPGERYSALSNS